MPLQTRRPDLPQVGHRDPETRAELQRLRQGIEESLRSIYAASATPYYPRTAAEVAAGATPVDYSFVPGDVRRYGATGDGTSDDSTAIETAISGAAGDGLVMVPAGLNCKITRRIAIVGKNLVFDARGARFTLVGNQAGFSVSGTVTRFTVLGGYYLGDNTNRDANTANAQIAWLFGDLAGANVKNVLVHGATAELTNVGFKASYGTGPNTPCDNVRFVACTARQMIGTVGGVGYGFQFAQADNSSIVDCFADQCQRHGIYLSEGQNYRVVGGAVNRNRDGLSAGTVRGGLAVSRSANVSVVGVTFYNNNDTALVIDVDTQGLSPNNVLNGVTVEGCVFRDSDLEDIRIGTTAPATDGIPLNVAIRGCVLRTKSGNSDSPISIQCGERISIIGNLIDGSSGTAALRAIALVAAGGAAYTDQIQVTENAVDTGSGYGVQIAAALATGTNVLRIKDNQPLSGTTPLEIVGGTLTNANLTTVLTGSATFNPTNLADGAGETTTVTVTGAVLGDFAEASFSLDLQGITLTAWVSAANTVSVRFQNETGGALDLASGTLRARVRRA